MNVIEELRWRGVLENATEGAEEALASESRTGYIGFDPTAESLHVGSLLPIMALVHLQRAGHTPVALVGGGTGLIGDPSGKDQEREFLDRERVEANLEGIRGQLEAFLDFDAPSNPARMVNNLDWLGEVGILEFLRDVGRHFPVTTMLRRESVRRRLEGEGAGLTFTEFSYQLLQAYDFLVLHDRVGCQLQMGGSDQWGNILAGIDLIRRARGERAYGVVLPLVTTSAGSKFGKTEEGTVWLSPERTSPYRFYQFWLNVDDGDVVSYLRYFTLLERERVEELANAVEERPHTREAQRALAEDVTRRVHGETELERAQAASRVLFGGALEGMSAREVEEIFADVPSSAVARSRLEGEGLPVVDLLDETELTPSRSEARRAVKGGGIYVNNHRVSDPHRQVTLEDAVEGSFVVLRKGKRNYHLVRLEG